MLDDCNLAQAIHRSRIAIISEIRLYREGLALFLAQLPDFEVVSTCDCTAESVYALQRVQCDMILLDMSAPGSASTARWLIREHPSVKIVGLAVAETEQQVLACVEAGVMGYVSRDGSIDDLVAALRYAARGEALCSPSVTGQLMRRVATLAHDVSPLSRLTPRELEIAAYLALGTTNRGIAASLGIELCTVKNHVHKILDKLKVSRRADVASCIGR